MLVLVHETPTRMRFNGDVLRQNSVAAESLVQLARSADGVRDASSNILTGSLIVHHGGDPSTRDAVLAQLGRETRIIVQAPPPPGATVERLGQAFMGAVLEQIVGRAVSAVAAALF